MGRKLITTVQLGGVVYPIGTDEADIDGEVTAAGVWDSEQASAADPDEGGEKPLADWKLAELKDELARRNAERDEDDQIVPAEPGNKPEIVAALEADDAASASA